MYVNLCGSYIPKYSFLKQYIIFLYSDILYPKKSTFLTVQFSTTLHQCSGFHKSDEQVQKISVLTQK